MKVHLARELVHINVDEFDFQANVGFCAAAWIRSSRQRFAPSWKPQTVAR